MDWYTYKHLAEGYAADRRREAEAQRRAWVALNVFRAPSRRGTRPTWRDALAALGSRRLAWREALAALDTYRRLATRSSGPIAPRRALGPGRPTRTDRAVGDLRPLGSGLRYLPRRVLPPPSGPGPGPSPIPSSATVNGPAPESKANTAPTPWWQGVGDGVNWLSSLD